MRVRPTARMRHNSHPDAHLCGRFPLAAQALAHCMWVSPHLQSGTKLKIRASPPRMRRSLFSDQTQRTIPAMATPHKNLLPRKPRRARAQRPRSARFAPIVDAEDVPSVSFTPEEIDRTLFPVIDRFLAGMSAPRVARAVTELTGVRMKRTDPYKLLAFARACGLVWVSPPRHYVLEGEFARMRNQGEVSVIDVPGERSPPNVPGAAAVRVYELIGQIAARRPGPVHIGLGIGNTTRRFAAALAARHRADRKAPELVLHALSPPHSLADPLETPLAFFPLFGGGFSRVQCVNLPAEVLVRCEDYDRLQRLPLVDEAFARAAEIDIAVTSLASSHDEHGYLRNYLTLVDPGLIDALMAAGWRGDAQLRPYGDNGPFPDQRGLRAVTLFDLPQLVEMAKQPDKHVFVLTSRCGRCAASKASALLPLLREPSLRIWNHLFIDFDTANEVVTSLDAQS